MTSMRDLMEAVNEKDLKPGENGYVSVQLHKEDAKVIRDHLKEIGFKDFIEPKDMHATLFYCNAGMEVMDHDPKKDYAVKSTSKYEILGNPPWKAVVLHMKSPDLEKRHKEIKATGAEHSYPDFKLHISLKYDAATEDLDLIKDHPIPLDTLRFNNETWADIKERDDD